MDYQKVQERMQRIKDTQFAKHRAHIHNRGDIVVVDWKRDNTNAYAVQYTFYKNHVFITGDLGGSTGGRAYEECAGSQRPVVYRHYVE